MSGPVPDGDLRPMTGLVLAGGASTRMGRDKAALDVGGEPLAARVVRLLRGVCREILVASGDGRRLAWLGEEQVADPAPGLGPLAGIVAGLERASFPLAAAVAVDLPFASPALLRLMEERWAGEDAVVPRTRRGLEPLHALYARSAASVLRARLTLEDRSMRGALAALRVRVVAPQEWAGADPSGRFARNLNRPDDLAMLAGSWPAEGTAAEPGDP